MHANRKRDLFSFNMPGGYHIWNVKCLYSFRDDLAEGLGKSVALECKKSVSGRRSSLKNFFFKLTFNTLRGGLFFRGGGGGYYQMYCLLVVGPITWGEGLISFVSFGTSFLFCT